MSASNGKYPLTEVQPRAAQRRFKAGYKRHNHTALTRTLFCTLRLVLLVYVVKPFHGISCQSPTTTLAVRPGAERAP